MGNRASTSMISLVVAGGLMSMVTVGVIQMASNAPLATTTSNQRELDALASSFAESLLTRPGHGWYTTACEAVDFDPDLVVDVGLAVDADCLEGGRLLNTLSLEKVNALHAEALSAFEYNDALDYAEMRAGMGLNDGDLNFRVDFKPYVKELGASVLYVGEYYTQLNGFAQCVQQVGPLQVPIDCMVKSVPPPICIQDCNMVNVADEATLRETSYLDVLVPAFDRATKGVLFSTPEIPFDLEGDVIPDASVSTDVWFLEALTKVDDFDRTVASTDEYQVVVIGSLVDDATFGNFQGVQSPYSTAAELLEAWVEMAGGTVIILGSDQSLEWTIPTFGVTYLDCHGHGCIGDEDPEDLLANDPYDLDYLNYPEPWGYWPHTFTTPGWDVAIDMGLMVSEAGEYGNGRVALTSWEPWNINQPSEALCEDPAPSLDCEGVRLLHNLLMALFHAFEFSYGPDVPPATGVGSAQRVMMIRDVTGAFTLTSTVQVSVWRGMYEEEGLHGYPFSVDIPYPRQTDWTDTFSLTSEPGTATFELTEKPVGALWEIHLEVTAPGIAAPFERTWTGTDVNFPALEPVSTVAGTWIIQFTGYGDALSNGVGLLDGTFTET